jgi:hypothetical protein
MNESGKLESEQSLSPSKQGRKIPFLVKAIFWDKPLFILTFSLGMIVIMIFPFVKIVILLSDPVKFDRIQRFGMPIMLMAFSVPAMFLCISIVAFVFLLRRKRKTGSYFLSREKLNESVARSLKPKPLWKVITIAALYCILAIDMTYSAMIRQHHRGFGWFLAALLWVCTIIIAASEFRLFMRKGTMPTPPAWPQTPPEA